MRNYERVFALEDIWEASSHIDFVVILGAFYSSSQKTLCMYLLFTSKPRHLNIVIDENKDKKNRRKGCLTLCHTILKDRAILKMFPDLH